MKVIKPKRIATKLKKLKDRSKAHFSDKTER